MHRAIAVAVLVCAAAPAQGVPIFTLEAVGTPEVAPGGTIDVQVRAADVEQLNLVQLELELPDVARVAGAGDIVAGGFFAGQSVSVVSSPPLSAVIIVLDDLSAELSGNGVLATFTLTFEPTAPLGTALVGFDLAHTFFEDGNDGSVRQEQPYQAGDPLGIEVIPEPATAAWLVLGVFVCLLRRRGRAAAFR